MLRSTLAALALGRGTVLTSAQLVDQLWGLTPPVTAGATLRNYIRRLRQALPAPLIETGSGGYTFTAHSDQVDVERFQQLLQCSRSLRDESPVEATALLGSALGLWHGTPLTGVGDGPLLAMERARLEDLYVTAVEEHFDLMLGLGRHEVVVDEIMACTRVHYHRERLVRQLMIALYRCGRAADALAAYRSTRERMVEELGIEPGVMLREAEQSILRSDPALLGPLGVTTRSRRLTPCSLRATG
ncbi:AfsR/SARP family transcriptional regulator [Streptomyces sp. NPDC048057]|uniref:AfsR/SARP family transcriptional regulator n=1 Tax=Streptomyces sp. NPDC048057 TaxID=3155628 RepID=UPI0033E5CCB8